MGSFYDTPGRKTQRAEWKYLHSTESAPLRRVLTRQFNKMFPQKHETSIRPFVREVVRRIKEEPALLERNFFKLMGGIHPEAMEIILKYGKDYAPYIWQKTLPEPKRGWCFDNAWILVETDKNRRKREKRKEPLVYVEGIAFGLRVKPMLHAWNALGLDGEIAYDWSIYAISHWTRYLGIPFTAEEHKKLHSLTPLGKKVHLIFHKKYFNAQAKARLISILEKRS